MRETKYKGKYLEVTEETIDKHVYERVNLRPGVKVYPIKNKKLLLINEFRKHEGGERWKVIGGWVDKEGKDPLTIAKEELMEEVGMVSDSWEEFHYINRVRATLNIETTFFVAQNPSPMDNPLTNPDSDVVKEVRWVSKEELQNLIDEQILWWDVDALVALQVLRKFG